MVCQCEALLISSVHCLTGSVKEQAQYSTGEQKEDHCQHIIGMLKTQDMFTMQSMVGVSSVQEQQSIQRVLIIHDGSNVGIAVRLWLICSDARKELNPPESLARVPRYCQD